MHLCTETSDGADPLDPPIGLMGKRASTTPPTVFAPSQPPRATVIKRAPSRLHWPARLPGVPYDDRLEVAVLLVVYSLCGREF